MPKFLYRTSEAKAALGVGNTTFYRLINNGTLDARRFGKRTYITAESLEALVASLKPVMTPTMTKAEAAGRGDPQPPVRERQSPRSRFGAVTPRPIDAE
jgi:excisionase family DNA binding protein